MKDDDQEELLRHVLGELLNIAAQVADLQASDEAAEDILQLCDYVADHFQIERAIAIVTENDDGSITTRFETVVGAIPTDDLTEDDEPQERPARGTIRTKNLPKLRLIDSNTPLDLPKRKPLDDDEEDDL